MFHFLACLSPSHAHVHFREHLSTCIKSSLAIFPLQISFKSACWILSCFPVHVSGFQCQCHCILSLSCWPDLRLKAKSFRSSTSITPCCDSKLQIAQGHTKLSYFYFLNVKGVYFCLSKRSTKLCWLPTKGLFWISLKEVVGRDGGYRAPVTPIWPHAPTPPSSTVHPI